FEDSAGDEYELYRVVFDITFFFFVIVILLAIIQGLIIDAFGELRDQQEQMREDMVVGHIRARSRGITGPWGWGQMGLDSDVSCHPQTKCFICGIGICSDDFGTRPHCFQTHTLEEHKLANYM
ncbi:Ryanodine receptor 1, partial [Camelus dromedarius]